MKYTHILFDLDGTISDSAPGITRCFRHAVTTLGFPAPDFDLLRRTIIGPPIGDGFLLHNIPAELVEEATRLFRSEYESCGWRENIPYDGIEETLQRLKNSGRKLYVATSKPIRSARMILEHFGFAKYFDYIAGADLSRGVGTKDEVLDDAFAHMGDVALEHVLMVGDRKYDLLGAVNHNIDALGVLYGYGTREELSQYPNVFLAETPQQAAEFILNCK